jgi:hypothetical protein
MPHAAQHSDRVAKQMRFLLALILIVSLAGCMSPTWHKSRVDDKTRSCLTVGANIRLVSECLAEHGISLKDTKSQYPYFISCWPYWGYPMVYSCGSVYITTKPDGTIESWKVEGTIEKLHG